MRGLSRRAANTRGDSSCFLSTSCNPLEIVGVHDIGVLDATGGEIARRVAEHPLHVLRDELHGPAGLVSPKEDDDRAGVDDVEGVPQRRPRLRQPTPQLLKLRNQLTLGLLLVAS